jgi:hypothetical protein
MATAGANGTVTPSGITSVNCGTNQTYTITPNTCYAIANVIVDGVSQGAITTYTFTNVTATHTISATFSQLTYNITATSGANGTVTPAGVTVVNCGANQTYTITPSGGFNVQNVIVDGVSQGAITTYTFTNVTAVHTISATFVSGAFTITASAGANGSISPSGAVSVTSGANQTFTITAAACYKIATVLVDGVNNAAAVSSGTFTFTNVTAAHTISATFTQLTYTITSSAGANGIISPNGATSVNCGANQTYTITPNACYAIANVIVDGVSQGAIGTYTFTNVTATHTISATFSQRTYTITASAGANGTVTPAGATIVNCGANQTYSITAAAGFAVQSVLVDGVSQGAITTYTFTNITAAHTISASFVAAVNSYTITASAGANGTITPSGAVSVVGGTNKTFTITAAACYKIATVLVDGINNAAAVSSGTYTFTNVTAAHTISATFSQLSYNITSSAGTGGSISPNGVTNVSCGTSKVYTITAASGFTIQNVVVDGISKGAVTTYTFSNVTAVHTITASFTGTCTIPATPGIISGKSSNLCGGGTFTYTIAPVPGATSYVWSVSGNAACSVTGTSTTATVKLPYNFYGTATLLVKAKNACGTSGARTLTLMAAPAAPTSISGYSTVSPNQSGLVYQVPYTAGLSYVWSVYGGTITSKPNPYKIIVKWGKYNGGVKVKVGNSCGYSPWVVKNITVSGTVPAISGGAVSESLYLKVYPNPTTAILTIEFNSGNIAKKYEVQVRDVSGRLLITRSGIATQRIITQQLDLSRYAHSIYIITLLVEGEKNRAVKVFKVQ